MGGFLSQIFGSAHDNVPLSDREILEVGPRGFFDDDLPTRYESRVVNFNTYLDDGRPPELRGLEYQDQYIDWDSDDSFTRALETIRSNTFERIENDPDLQALLSKESWTRDDRVDWESRVSTIVSEEHANIPGLDIYRNEADAEKYPDVERRASRLNDLSVDIDNDTLTIEHDCESNSIVEGVILQQVENAFLPESAPEGDYRVASDYFYTVGRSNFSLSGELGSHAWIISSATTNAIEATSLGNPYKENINPDMTFEDYIRGDMIVNSDTSIYSGFHKTLEDFTRVRIDTGEIDFNQIYESMPLRSQITEEAYNSAPPEAQSLMAFKGEVVRLEELQAVDCNIVGLEGQIQTSRAQFDRTLDELAEDGGIYEAMIFANRVKIVDPRDNRYAGFASKDFSVMVEDMGGAVMEMHPEFSEDEMVDFIFDIYIGALPDVGGQSFTGTDYDEFYDVMGRKLFAEQYPELDYDAAKTAFNHSEPNNMISAMRRGDLSMEALMENPEAAMALAYNEIHIGINKDTPKPGTMRAYGQTAERVEQFYNDYDAFKAQLECVETQQNIGLYGLVMR